ncbi:NUDIX hydrolase [Arthrobacter sp. VKM Ac-2550]|uniref:NUDIX hydrolase n=1 Tax=Crystallibacter permensis TaxID=1938888 RepID=UPI002226920F|nr:NUDIX hydrolase [Arthrobacter sp. VKM Ac-2550]MCW2134819.1 8-oxo-dGTP pyrophosphatase MutT, NUDIX family [Arthrobacter sp. VKM Ac-2550]
MTLVGSAATVVLLRDSLAGPEVLLLERPRHTGSFAGAWVFPGGRVDPEDYASADANNDGGADGNGDEAYELAAARRAGVRETLEETGVVVPPESLVRVSCWIPPTGATKRLKTWFFLAPAPEQEIKLNEGELMDYAWLTPAEALRRHQEAVMQLVTPTWVTLHLLLQDSTVAGALERAASAEPETFQSRRLAASGGSQVIVWAGDAEYEPGSLAAQATGKHRLTMNGLNWNYERS